MGWFSKTSSEGTAQDAQALREALVTFLEYVEGELPRAESQRTRELVERLQAFPVPTGIVRQTQVILKALRATGIGAGSADFADAAKALVQAMQRVSIHDKELTAEIGALEAAIPVRIRNADARSLEVGAKEIDKSAKAARFRTQRSEAATVAMVGALEQSLKEVISMSSSLEGEVASIRSMVDQLALGRDSEADRAAVVAALRRLEGGLATSRQGVDHGLVQSRAVLRHLRTEAEVTARSPDVVIDSLTSLPDKNSFFKALPLAILDATRGGSLVSLMRICVDNIAKVNEEFHRSSGDDVLRTVGATVVEQLRGEDFVARLDGDDFVALLPDTGTREATGAAKRLTAKVARMVFTHQQMTFSVTLSIGVVTWDGHESADSLIERAEHALQRAREGGGGQHWAAQTFQAG